MIDKLDIPGLEILNNRTGELPKLTAFTLICSKEHDVLLKAIEWFLCQPPNAWILINTMTGIPEWPRLEGVTLLSDMIEDQLHHSMYKPLCQKIKNMINRVGLQVIAITYSYEFIEAAYEVFKDHQDKLSYIRIDKIDGKLDAKVFDYETIETAIYHNMEMR